jgi:tetratricopeptide (TPR) repeat protein
MLLVIGTTGVGKSTFIHELVREEKELGTLVLEGRALPMELSQPYFVLQEAMRNLPSVRQQAEDSDRSVGQVGVAGAGFLSASRPSRSLVPLGLLPFQEEERESPQQREARLLEALSGDSPSVEESRMELFEGLASHLEDVAAQSPLLLVLEDLHHADESSLEFLSFLAHRGHHPSLRLILSSLPEAEAPPFVRVHLETLEREGLVRRLVLRPLSEAEAGELVQLLRGDRKVKEEQITKWHTLTEGNPLFLEQLVRGEMHGETAGIGEELGAGRAPTELPRGEELRQVLRRRLREMKEPERRALSYASVLGTEFSFPVLHRASGEEEEQLAEAIEALVRRGFLREKGGERFEFAQEGLRGEVYTSLTEVRRGILHRKVAETLEKELPKQGAPDPHLIYELARHWYIAQVDAKALEYNLKAAELGKKAVSPSTAAYHLERALETHRRMHPNDRTHEVDLAIDLALQLDLAGDIPHAVRVLEEMRAHGQRGREAFSAKDRARVAVHLAKILTHTGEMLRAIPVIDEALETLGPDGDQQLIGHAYRLRGTVEFYRGRYPEAEQEYLRSRACFERSEAPLEAARAKISLANVRGMNPKVPVAEVEHLYQEAIQELEAAGDLGEAATAANNLALLYMERVGIPEAIRGMEEALRLAERSGEARMMGWCQFNMADLMIRSNRIDEAEAWNDKSRTRLLPGGDKIALIQVNLNTGRIQQARGDFAHAELSLLEAYRIAREVALEPDELEVLFRLAQLSEAREDYASADQKLRELRDRRFAKIRPDMMPEMRELLRKLGAKGHTMSGWEEGSDPAPVS